MVQKNDYIKKFRRLVMEYTSPSFNVEEDGEDDMAMGGAPADPSMGGDPNAMGGDPNAMGGAPADPSMGGDPNAMGGAPADPSMGGGDPNAAGGTPPEGFAPQGVDQNAGLDGMGSDPNAAGGAPADPSMGGDPNAMGGAPADPNAEGGDDEVIDVDDLTDSQEDTEKKVDALTSKFEKVMHSLDDIENRINTIDAHTNQYLGSLKSEMEKRNPTPQQRLTMRSTKSAPYSMSPNEYMNNYAPDNYSDADDNNGADDPQYKITKGDIDSFTDYSSIANELNGKMGLRDILGY